MTGYYQRQNQNQNKAPKLCYTCHRVPIVFDSNIRSSKGTPIPLDANTRQPHDCPESEYNKQQRQLQQFQPSRQQPQQQPINPEEIGIAIANMNEALHLINDILIDIQTHLYSLKPNDVNIKDKEELLRENAELKEALSKIQQNEFKPASQLSSSSSQHPDPSEQKYDEGLTI